MPTFYQYLEDITWAVDFSSVKTDYPRPTKIYERRLISDERTYCCEITPSTYFEVLDYSVDMGDPDLDENTPASVVESTLAYYDEAREFWLSQTDEWEKDNGYVKYSSVFSYDGICQLTYFGVQGEEVDDEDGKAWDKAREWAQGNSLV